MRTKTAAGVNPSAYYVDMLFRSNHPITNASAPEMRAEAARIFTIGVRKDYVPADRVYLAELVLARTGLSQAEAEKRVDEVTAQAKRADAARKVVAYFSIFTALSMLIGAFIAASSGSARGSASRRALAH